MSLSKNELCYDIMEMIGKEYTKIKTNIKETNKNKKLHGEIIKHLNYYCDYYDYLITPEYIKGGLKKIDTEFLEHENLWCSGHHIIIASKYGGADEYEDWCEDYFSHLRYN